MKTGLNVTRNVCDLENKTNQDAAAMNPLVTAMRLHGVLAKLLTLLWVLPMLLGPSVARAAGPTDHPHHLSLIVGATEKSGKWAETLGVEYTYRLNQRWALGGWYEQSSGDFELESLGVLANLYATDHLALMLGAGSERDLFSEPKFLGRLGANYQFHIGPATVAPTAWVDLVENGKELYFLGITVGTGF